MKLYNFSLRYLNRMHSQLQDKISLLTLKTDIILNYLENYDPEILQKKPGEEQWSVIQVLNHLIMSESASLSYVKKKILGIDTVKNVGLKEKLKMKIMQLSFNGRNKFKAPAYVSSPDNHDSLQDIKVKWARVRKDLRDFAENYPAENIRKAIYRHPISGRISLPHMFDFFRYHVFHHQRQIERILNIKIN